MRERKLCGRIQAAWLGNCKGPCISCHPMGFQRAGAEPHNGVDRWPQTGCSRFLMLLKAVYLVPDWVECCRRIVMIFFFPFLSFFGVTVIVRLGAIVRV